MTHTFRARPVPSPSPPLLSHVPLAVSPAFAPSHPSAHTFFIACRLSSAPPHSFAPFPAPPHAPTPTLAATHVHPAVPSPRAPAAHYRFTPTRAAPGREESELGRSNAVLCHGQCPIALMQWNGM
ncbi:hypothetical protein VTO73DRAFT_504 [Trametes versicolor]